MFKNAIFSTKSLSQIWHPFLFLGLSCLQRPAIIAIELLFLLMHRDSNLYSKFIDALPKKNITSAFRQYLCFLQMCIQ